MTLFDYDPETTTELDVRLMFLRAMMCPDGDMCDGLGYLLEAMFAHDLRAQTQPEARAPIALHMDEPTRR